MNSVEWRGSVEQGRRLPRNVHWWSVDCRHKRSCKSARSCTSHKLNRCSQSATMASHCYSLFPMIPVNGTECPAYQSLSPISLEAGRQVLLLTFGDERSFGH